MGRKRLGGLRAPLFFQEIAMGKKKFTSGQKAARKEKRVAEMVESFVEDLDSDIDAQVRELSIEDYVRWLSEFTEAVNTMLRGRIEAAKEDVERG
jgi:hypothetical protein